MSNTALRIDLEPAEEAILAERIGIGLLAQERLASGVDSNVVTIRDLRMLVHEGNASYRRFICCKKTSLETGDSIAELGGATQA